MTAIYTKIKADFIQARKDKLPTIVSLLSTVIGEMDNEASRDKSGSKEVTDETAIKVLKSFSKNLDEVIKHGDPEGALRHEKAIIEGYLPQQMDRAALSAAITAYGVFTLKDIMSHLKTTYPGLYDGKLASEVAKEFI